MRLDHGLTVKLRFLRQRHALPPGPPAGLDWDRTSSVLSAPPRGDGRPRFQGGTGKLVMDVTFDPWLAPGAKVWFTAFFFNRRKESGPAATPISANLPGGSAMPPAAAA